MEAQERNGAGARLKGIIERTIQRNIKGVGYFASPAPPVGLTPKDVVYRRGPLQLYHYHPLTEEVYRTPVLIVMATTNRSYVLDLAPGQSFIEFLLNAGYDVFVLDWDAPRPEDKRLGIAAYTQDLLPDCIERVLIESGERDISILSYCMGGVLAVIYAATHADGPLRNLVCFTTPVDFTKLGLFSIWSDRKYFDVDRLVDSLGNVPPDIITAAFDMLRPATKAVSPIHLWDKMWDDEFIASFRKFDRWATDTLPLAGEYFRDIVKELVWGNKLLKGALQVRGREVDLRNVRAPLLHIVAEHDHIVTREASDPLIALAGSKDKRELILKGGHVSVVVGASAVRRLWPQLDAWLSVRSA